MFLKPALIPGNKGGWHKIAWAFLRLSPKPGIQNTGNQLRLQLYKPERPKLTTKSITKCDIYQYWSKKQYQKYPSTLYVTIKKLFPNFNTPKVLRSRNPIEREYETRSINSITIDDHQLVKKEEENGKVKVEELSPLNLEVKWKRIGSCKVPNRLKWKLHVGSRGCFMVNFSNDGCFLACAVANDDLFDIVLYQVRTHGLI